MKLETLLDAPAGIVLGQQPGSVPGFTPCALKTWGRPFLSRQPATRYTPKARKLRDALIETTRGSFRDCRLFFSSRLMMLVAPAFPGRILDAATVTGRNTVSPGSSPGQGSFSDTPHGRLQQANESGVPEVSQAYVLAVPALPGFSKLFRQGDSTHGSSGFGSANTTGPNPQNAMGLWRL